MIASNGSSSERALVTSPSRAISQGGSNRTPTNVQDPRTDAVRALLGLSRACHPGPVVAVSTASFGYALAIGCSRREAARVGFSVFMGQLAIGWHNDWTDAARDLRAARHDKPIANGEVARSLVGAAAAIAALSCVPASLANGRRAGTTHLVAVASAVAYNAWLKSTPLSFVPYAVSFSLLPVIAHQSGKAVRATPPWASATAGTLGIAAHLLNVLPDRETDRCLGVLGLPQRLSPGQCIGLAGGLLAASSALVSFGPRRGARSGGAGFALSIALSATALREGRRRNDRRSFRLVLLIALADVAQLLWSSSKDHRRGALVPAA